LLIWPQTQIGNWGLPAKQGLAVIHGPARSASRAYYDRKSAEGKKHNAALICLSRRRCDVLFAMLRNGETYRPSATAA
jgi:hypothetical protein